MSAYRFAVKYRWWLIAAFATIFFVFAGYEVSILPDAIADKCKQPNSTDKYYCPGYVVAGSSLEIVAAFLRPYSEVLTALSGVAVAAFTFTLWLTTRDMWRASTLQLRHSEKTAERQLRAYVGFFQGDFGLIETDKGRQFIRAHVELKNFGQTPAYDYGSWSILEIVDADTDPFDEKDEREAGGAYVGPGAHVENSPVKGPIDTETLDAIKQGKKWIVFWGEASYVDAFGDSHVFEFRVRNARVLANGKTWPLRIIRTTEKKKS